MNEPERTSDKPREKQSLRRTLLWWTLITVATATLFTFLSKSFENGKYFALQNNDIAQLEMIGRAMIEYGTDHDDRLPPDTSSIRAVMPQVEPYLRGKEWAPKKDEPFEWVSKVPDSPEFLGNSNLAATRWPEFKDPDRHVLFFESGCWPNDVRVVSFIDSSVRRVSEQNFQRAVTNSWRDSP